MAPQDILIAIIPRHQRLLNRLFEQRSVDPFGGIGWRGLMDDDELFTPEQLFVPLLERGLIEDCREAHQRESGKCFVHITALGIMCMNYGYMLKHPRRMSGNEMKALEKENPNGEKTGEIRPEQKTAAEAGAAEAEQRRQPGAEATGAREGTSSREMTS